MKKIIYLLLLFVIFKFSLLIVFANSEEEKKYSMFVTFKYFNLGITYPGGEVPQEFSSSYGMFFAPSLSLGYFLTDKLSIVSELGYSISSISLKNNNSNFSSWKSRDFIVQFLEFSLGGRLSLTNNFSIQGGFYVGDPVGSWEYIDYGENSQKLQSGSISDRYRNVDFGYFIGLNSELMFEDRSSFTFGIRYRGGFRNVVETEDYKLKYGSLSLSIGTTGWL